MEREHRNKIIRNLVQLTRIRNSHLFWTELLARNVFTEEMVETIRCSTKNSHEQLQQLFLQSCKRGPTAFPNIVRALIATGNIPEARLLDPKAQFYYEDEAAEVGDDEVEDVDQVDHQITAETDGRGQCYNLTTFRQPASKIAPEKAYRMSSSPRGLVLILNVIDFDGNPDLRRDGAEKDAQSLRNMWTSFGYEVFEVTNPKKKDLLCPRNGIIKNFTDRFTTRTLDSCVVIIMSHGEDNFWIQTSDCESIRDETAHLIHLWEDILPRFNNHSFPVMRNKPKLFIVQSCRGERLHHRVRITPVATYYSSTKLQIDSGKRRLDKYPEIHPEFNHMMVLQSTIPGYVTIRHEDHGSPFIQTICEVFEQLGKLLPLSELIPVIARRLQNLPGEEGGPQTCTFKTIGYVKPFQLIPLKQQQQQEHSITTATDSESTGSAGE